MCKTCTSFSARRPLDPQPGEERDAPVRECPDLDVHWRYDEAQETIQRLARQRDEALAGVRVLARENIECHERVAEGCGHPNHGESDHDCAPFLPAAQPRPLAPDDITDEMVRRGLDANGQKRAEVNSLAGLTMRAILTAALTVPTRPEGAEEMADLIHDWSKKSGTSPAGAIDAVADFLASHGARVEVSGR